MDNIIIFKFTLKSVIFLLSRLQFHTFYKLPIAVTIICTSNIELFLTSYKKY